MTKEEMLHEISRWKKEKNAIILAHYYQKPEIQELADYVGDSLKLSQIASETDADIIVFAGVHFMAETAKLLSPDKKVLLPVKEAGCGMADMMLPHAIKKYKEEHPDTVILMYVNSTAECKQYADVCVTSSNAMRIIRHYKELGKPMLYGPDRNLGSYAMAKTNVKLDLWPGFCAIHNAVRKETVLQMKRLYPNALFIAHPECRMEVLELADYVGSTKELIEFATASKAKEYIVGTEQGVLYEMKKKNPEKQFYILSDRMTCRDMKLTNIEDIYICLKEEKNEIVMDKEIIERARKCVFKMLELS